MKCRVVGQGTVFCPNAGAGSEGLVSDHETY